MRNSIIKYSIYIIVLVLVQVLVLNNMQFSSYVNPYCYVLIILILPFETPGWLLLSIAFALGFTIDVFPQGWSGDGASLGFHAFSTVMMAFSRPFILNRINSRDEYEAGTYPSASDYGIAWWLRYSMILVGIHHFSLFLLESMDISRLPETILRSLLSGAFTLFLLALWELLRYRRK